MTKRRRTLSLILLVSLLAVAMLEALAAGSLLVIQVPAKQLGETLPVYFAVGDRTWILWKGRRPPDWAGQINYAGLRYNRYSNGDGNLSVPSWYISIAAGAMAFWPAWRLAPLRGYGKGRCARCGYDMRATPDRCPECGHRPGQISTDETRVKTIVTADPPV
jgi:hypothetical protein